MIEEEASSELRVCGFSFEKRFVGFGGSIAAKILGLRERGARAS